MRKFSFFFFFFFLITAFVFAMAIVNNKSFFFFFFFFFFISFRAKMLQNPKIVRILRKLAHAIYRGGSNNYPQSMFWNKNKKHCIPQYTPVLLRKVGFKGVHIIRTCYPNVNKDSIRSTVLVRNNTNTSKFLHDILQFLLVDIQING